MPRIVTVCRETVIMRCSTVIVVVPSWVAPASSFQISPSLLKTWPLLPDGGRVINCPSLDCCGCSINNEVTDLFELGYIHLGKRENEDKKCHEERCHISEGSHPGRGTRFAFRALFLFIGLEVRFKIYTCQPIALPAHSSSTMTSILRFCDLPKAVVLSAIGRVSAKPAI